MQKRTSKKSDSAVSPVVGVMLMLVVTIIIAAIVATMATGMMPSETTTPSIVSSASMSATDGLTYTVSGVSESIAASDLQITVSALKNGEYLSRVITPSGSAIIPGTTLSYSSAKSLLSSNVTNTLNITDFTLSDSNWNLTINDYAPVATWNDDADHTKGAATWTYDGVSLTDYQNPIASWTKVQCAGAAEKDFYYYLVEMKEQYTLSKNSGEIEEYELIPLTIGDSAMIDVVYLPSDTSVFSKTVTVGA